jgi:hypothetical protein
MGCLPYAYWCRLMVNTARTPFECDRAAMALAGLSPTDPDYPELVYRLNEIRERIEARQCRGARASGGSDAAR